jgi:tetratricopeptide (TPR) repeat protein
METTMFRIIPGSVLLIGLLISPAVFQGERSATDGLIKNLQVKVKLHPEDYKALAGLGAAYLQKGRESGDAADYELAKSALERSLSLVSNDPAAGFAMTQMAVACMAEHRFVDAYEWAQRALATGSGDPSPWAIAGDALADVGEYEQAANAYSKLTTSFGSEDEQQAIAYQRESRMSYLSFISGDTPGAIQRTKKALEIANELHMPAENIAWTNYQLGEEYFQAGALKLAESAYRESLSLLPGYYRALAGLAKVQTARGNQGEAAELYEAAIAAVPYPEYAAALGDRYQAMGQVDKARRAYDLVEFIGHLSEINQQIHNRELALFYADHGVKLDRAESLARAELNVRQDIYTWDVLAWVLYKKGNFDEAYTASRKALQFGTRDALLQYHGGVIAAEIGKPDEAQVDLTAALEINPQFHPTYADAARKKLSLLATAPSSKASIDADAH